MTAQTSFADWYKDAYAGFPQEHRAAGAAGLDLVFVEQDSHETVDEMGDTFCFGLMTRFDQGATWYDFGHGRKVLPDPGPGDLVLQPPGSDPHMMVEGRHDLLLLMFPNASVGALLGEASPAPGTFDALTKDVMFRDREARHLLLSLWDTSVKDGPMAGLKVDSLFQLLLVRLTELAGEAVRRSDAGLSSEQIAKTCAMIEDRLAERVTLPELAQEIGVSPYHFARQFKAKTGDTLHGYLTERRLERAKRALAAPTDSLAEIAYDCGFSSQQHMTTTFSKHLGITPARYRKAVTT